MRKSTLPLFFLFISILLHAQVSPPDSIEQRIKLETVTVTATRINESSLSTPWAVTAIPESTLDLSSQQLNLNDFLEGVPGVFTNNAYNFAQDLRVSIRGFGARSPFGIRGVKILVDGLPESTPDGQGQVDNLDLGMVEGLEVLRGTNSSLYGNASGGIISLQTDSFPTVGFMEVGTRLGSYGFQRHHIKGGQGFRDVQYLINASYTSLEGYRDHSAFRNAIVSGKLRWWLDDTATLMAIINYGNSPEAQDPGGLTAEERRVNRRRASTRNRQFDSGEKVEQIKTGLVLDKQFGYGHNMQAHVYRLGRNFENKLPFAPGGSVALEREVWGAGVRWNWEQHWGVWRYRSKLGAEAEWQADDRTRFNNLDGRLGDRSFEQLEEFRNYSAFAIQQLDWNNRVELRFGGRFDNIEMSAKDRFLSDGDNSDSQTYSRVSPSVGLSIKMLPAHYVYANWATGFETPVLSERFGNPQGLGGISGNLKPQFSINYEAGFRGRFQERFQYELAFFYIQLEDELIPFKLNAFPGRTFFRNAGQSERSGLEFGLRALWSKNWSSRVSYSYSDFQFSEYEIGGQQLEGNLLPGIPKHQAFASVRYRGGGLFAALQARYVGTMWADDNNATQVPEYMVLNLRAGYHWHFYVLAAEPFIGINNLSNTQFPANIRINAAANRFFEPGPPLNFYVGIRLRIGELEKY